MLFYPGNKGVVSFATLLHIRYLVLLYNRIYNFVSDYQFQPTTDTDIPVDPDQIIQTNKDNTAASVTVKMEQNCTTPVYKENLDQKFEVEDKDIGKDIMN